MERYVCVHGHFYQPPRENPWLESIEMQDSAYPYHDWNERIERECYAPNAQARILDDKGRIVDIVDNYRRISFNFGPTLLSWMESHAPDLLAAVREADAESAARFSGHGSAMAQVYNHMILPLANERDKRTQVAWGIRDFERHFNREPEGMWLPETAVDVATLEVLAEHGIRFTVLAPYQARRFREKGETEWTEAPMGIDPTRAYECPLPSGRSIALFFYDGPISRAIAFEQLLHSGEGFAQRLVGGFSDERDWPQLMHVATDGETYGHHHRYGEMALAYALRYIEEKGLAKVTNYGEFLDKFPPRHEVEIHENTAWSCAHGIERWRADCGCHIGGGPDWNQAWRGPLRDSLDWLRDQLAATYEKEGALLLKEAWAARDGYIDVILERGEKSRADFFSEHARKKVDAASRVRILRLMEMQRNAMLMYTSCGWFFDDISGIEATQVLRYAGRAIQLHAEMTGRSLESGFLSRLVKAKSNIGDQKDGAAVYGRYVKPQAVDLEQVAAHYAVSSLFEEYGDAASIACYRIRRDDERRRTAGRARLAVGRGGIHSTITTESLAFSYAVLHLGDHNLTAGVRPSQDDDGYRTMAGEVGDAFARGDFTETIRAIDRHFGDATYSLGSLFRDEQTKVLQQVLDTTLGDVTATYRQIYEENGPLMRYLSELGTAMPRALRTSAEFLFDSDIRTALDRDTPDFERIRDLLDQAALLDIELDEVALEFAIRQALERFADRWSAEPNRLEYPQTMSSLLSLADSVPVEVDLWRAQNVFHQHAGTHLADMKRRADRSAPHAMAWVDAVEVLGQQLKMKLNGSG